MSRRTTMLCAGWAAGLLLAAGCSVQQTGQPAAGTPLAESSASPASSAGPSTTALEPGTEVSAAVVEQSVLRPMQTESDSFWDEIFGLAGYSGSVNASMKFLDAGESYTCGDVPISAADPPGPAYCAAEDEIVVTNQFMADLGASEVLRADGSFADPADDVGVYFLLAHEWGHNVIIELAEEEKLDLTAVPPVEIETLSDCLAGLMIAGVPRVFADKDPDAVLAYAQRLPETFGGTAGSTTERQAAVQTGMAVSYDDRQAFVNGVDQCVQLYAPVINGQRS